MEDIAIRHEHQGKSAVRIADEHDLTLAEVHAALAYYIYLGFGMSLRPTHPKYNEPLQ